MGLTFVAARKEARDWIDHRVIELFRSLGHEVVLISNSLGVGDVEAMVATLDAIVLTGGNDVGEFAQRDRLELQLIELASKRALPVLGICRGAQVITLFFGGRLQKLKGHAGQVHEIEPVLENGNFRRVASHHNFGIEPVAPLSTLVVAGDGTSEAFFCEEPRLLGLMWHPERQSKTDGLASDQYVLSKFFRGDQVKARDFFCTL